MKTIDLRTTSLKDIEVGDRVITTKGFAWIQQGDYGWLDDTSQLSWGPIHKEKLNHYEATEKYGRSLPTKDEFEEAEKHGIREVLEMENLWFFSSSVYPYSTGYAYVFSGSYGGIGSDNRDNYNESVVCVQGR